MRIIYNEKTHNIDDKYLDRLMKNLPCTKEEAIQIVAEEEGWVTNENTAEMDRAEKEQKEILRTIHKAISREVINKKMNGEITRGSGKKPKDDIKINIVAELAEYLKTKYKNVDITNESKLITFTVNGEQYKLDLTKTRVKK
jgi:hypothetical protein